MENKIMPVETMELIDKMRKTAERVVKFSAGRQEVDLRKAKKKFDQQEKSLDMMDLSISLDTEKDYDVRSMLALHYNVSILRNTVSNSVLRTRLSKITKELDRYVSEKSKNKSE